MFPEICLDFEFVGEVWTDGRPFSNGSFPFQCEGKDCKFKCNSANDSFDCFLLDNNGFILAVANNSETVGVPERRTCVSA